MARQNYWYLPTGWLVRLRFDSLERVRTLKVPVLFIHGKLDVKIPFEMAKELYDAAFEPKTQLLIEDAGHANSGAIGWVEYKNRVTAFVREHFNRAE